MQKWKIGAIVGGAWAVLSTVGLSSLYSAVGREPASLGYKILFSYVLLLDSVTKSVRNFSLTYALVYAYRYDFLTFLFLVLYLGLLGAALGGEMVYLLEKILQRLRAKENKFTPS